MMKAGPSSAWLSKQYSAYALRFSEFGLADWSEIEGLDGASPLWRAPEGRMKMKKPHIVPLSKQAVAVVRELQELTGGKGYVFPSPQQGHKPVTNNGVLRAISHGLQEQDDGTWLPPLFFNPSERAGLESHWIEKTLAHESKSRVRRAYNAAQYLDGR